MEKSKNFSLGCGPLIDTERWCYHYTSSEVALDHILSTNELKFNALRDLNDPKESGCLGWLGGGVPSEEHLRNRYVEVEEQVDREFRNSVKVFCSSTDRSPAGSSFDRGHMKPRMWAQYGNESKGVCLVFSRSRLRECVSGIYEESLVCGSVEYTDDRHRMAIPMMRVGDLELPTSEIAKSRFIEANRQIVFTKYRDWSDEAEWRLACYDERPGPIYVDFQDSLSAIVAGPMCGKEELDLFRDEANKRGIIGFSIRWNHTVVGGSRLN